MDNSIEANFALLYCKLNGGCVDLMVSPTQLLAINMFTSNQYVY